MMRRPDLDLESRTVRVEQSKGLKDRVVPLGQPVVEALRAYLKVRGPAPTDHVFISRHLSLSTTYCVAASAPIDGGAGDPGPQTNRHHVELHSSLREYSGYRLLPRYGRRRRRLGLHENEDDPTPMPGQLLALVDALHDGTLNDVQRETVKTLRDGILALVGQMAETV